MNTCKLIPALDALRNAVIGQLQENDLPVNDLTAQSLLFAYVNESNELVGTAGLELFETSALMRSVSIQKDQQGMGIGKHLVKELETLAAAKGIRDVYLLTTTAKTFFEREGYMTIDRSLVPETIRQTTEFSTVCPSSATIMKKTLP